MDFEEYMGAELSHRFSPSLQHLLRCSFDIDLDQFYRLAVICDVLVKSGRMHAKTFPFIFTAICKSVTDSR